ncbi:MAG: RNA polymerase factor sigma-54 [Rhodobacteraceae bacterium]|nr:RNA polymerase factor sigma-54 [Paracoccaceae bacterium]
MSLRPSLRPSLRTGVALTPGMQQSLQILRMTATDLTQEIEREAGENPFLRVARADRSAYDFALETVAALPSLGESLRQQIGLMVLPPNLRAIALYLTGEVRDDGYFDSSVEDVASATSLDRADVAEALTVLQRCEPTGVGARNLQECLALQLCEHGLERYMADRVVRLLPLFAEKRWADLSRALGLPEAEVQRIGGALRQLRTRPVPEAEAPAAPLTPDLIVDRDGSGALRARLGRRAVPVVALDTSLVKMVAGKSDPFIQAAHGRATALVRAVRMRGRTLLRIGERLVHDQSRFFALGPEHLAPMSRQQMAEALAVHPATLGRAVAGKALLADGVLYPLSLFFSSSLPGPDGNDVSSYAIQWAIRRLIDAEPAGRPLSDARICDKLRHDGVDISRRTVAKYRGCMRIPSSSERRRRKD